MTNAYRLYERLGGEGRESGELSALALSIARDVHEVKKDNLRIIRGIEGRWRRSTTRSRWNSRI